MRLTTAAVLRATLTLASLTPGALPAGKSSTDGPCEVGHHLVLHIKTLWDEFPHRAIVAAADTPCGLMMYAHRDDSGDIYRSDGYGQQGDAVERRATPQGNPIHWTRYDVVVEDDTYRFEMGKTIHPEARPWPTQPWRAPWTAEGSSCRVSRTSPRPAWAGSASMPAT